MMVSILTCSVVEAAAAGGAVASAAVAPAYVQANINTPLYNKFLLAASFKPPMLRPAKSLASPYLVVNGLQDFTDYPFITIDKESTEYREDAIYIEDIGGGKYFVVVAFANQNRDLAIKNLEAFLKEIVNPIELKSFTQKVPSRALFMAFCFEYNDEKPRETLIFAGANGYVKVPFPFKIVESYIGDAFVMPYENLYYTEGKAKLFKMVEGGKMDSPNLQTKLWNDFYDILDPEQLKACDKYRTLVNFLMIIARNQTANLLGVGGGDEDEGGAVATNMKNSITQKVVREKIKELLSEGRDITIGDDS